jgi:O-antigen/teichoic acid export membrane protein
LPNTYSIAVTVAALSIPQSTLRLDAIENLVIRYGLLGELARSGVIAVVFVTVIATVERKFLLGCWRKFGL